MSNLKILYKIIFGLLGISAIGYEIIKLLSNDKFSAINYFSQWTTLTNLLAVAMLLISAGFLAKNKNSKILEYMRGASTVYLVTTGIAFGLLLTKYITNVTDIPWSNFSLHYIMPVAIIIDWFLDQPKAVIYFKQALLWLLFPVVYIIYLLVRGQASGNYIYPIFDPSTNSWGKISLTIVGLLLMVFVLSYLISRFGPEKS